MGALAGLAESLGSQGGSAAAQPEAAPGCGRCGRLRCFAQRGLPAGLPVPGSGTSGTALSALAPLCESQYNPLRGGQNPALLSVNAALG